MVQLILKIPILTTKRDGTFFDIFHSPAIFKFGDENLLLIHQVTKLRSFRF
jgi:hypothetical protein